MFKFIKKMFENCDKAEQIKQIKLYRKYMNARRKWMYFLCKKESTVSGEMDRLHGLEYYRRVGVSVLWGDLNNYYRLRILAKDSLDKDADRKKFPF